MATKRKEYLSWKEYFMGNALLASMRSKDPSNQVGACIVDEETKKILSIGYNGLTRGMNDDDFDWSSTGEKTGDKLLIKDYYVVHAERNAILNFNGDLRGKTLYVTWFPCTECTKELIQAGLKKIIYLREFSKQDEVEISKIMLKNAGVLVEKYNSEREISKDEVIDAMHDIQAKITNLSTSK